MKNKLLLSILLAAIALGSYWIVSAGNRSPKATVKVESLKPSNFDESLVFQGVISPKENIPIYTDTPTVIKSILVKEGSEVKKGENLLEFNATIKEDLERELEVVELDIRSRRLQLNDLNSGSIKLELDQRTLERKTLEEDIKSLNRDIELVSFEAKTLDEQARVMEELLKRKGISSTEANEARSLADRKKNEFEDLKTSLNLSKQRYDLSVVSYQRLRRELLLNQNNVNGEYQKLLLQKSNIKRKLAEITEPLKAPFDGIVTEVTVTEGTTVAQGAKLLSLSPGKDFLIKLDIPLSQSKWIKLGQKALIVTRGGFEKRNYSGEVSDIAKIAKVKENLGIQRRILEIEVLVEDPEGMKPGYITNVELSINHQNKVNAISSFSVIEEGGINYVYVLEGDVVNKTRVDLGIKTSSKYEVLNLPLGTEIIVNPFKVKDGQQVTVIR